MIKKFVMTIRGPVLGLIAAFTLMSYAPAQAADSIRPDVDVASEFVSDLARQAINILKESDAQTLTEREAVFRDLLSRGFDLRVIGRLILGRHWRSATKEQRSDYLDLFTDYILRTYASMLGGYHNETFRIGRARAAGKADLEIDSTIVRPEGPPIPIVWRVRIIKEEYRIIDVRVEGVSMVIAKREEFDSVVKNQGMDGLLAALQPQT